MTTQVWPMSESVPTHMDNMCVERNARQHNYKTVRGEFSNMLDEAPVLINHSLMRTVLRTRYFVVLEMRM